MKETTLSKITASVRVAKEMAGRALAASPNGLSSIPILEPCARSLFRCDTNAVDRI